MLASCLGMRHTSARTYIVSFLGQELQKIQATPEFRDLLTQFGMEPLPSRSPDEFAVVVATEQVRWAKAVKDSGAKVD